MSRTYAASVGEVFSHVGSDRDIIGALAKVSDTLKIWPNPDDWDYPVSKTPYIEARADGLYGIRSQHVSHMQSLATEMFSHEIRTKHTLGDLAKMYKRLKPSPEFPAVVLHNILLKMLWLSSGRGKVLQAA